MSARNHREADDAYIAGARKIERGQYAEAEKDFGRAIALDPAHEEYLRAFAYAREGRVSELIHAAAAARQSGDVSRSALLLEQAHALDPDNRIVSEHLQNGSDTQSRTFDPLRFPTENIASTLGGAIELKPSSGTRTLHENGGAEGVLRDVYAAWGITVQFDGTLPAVSGMIHFDLENATFSEATRLARTLTSTFAVPVQPTVALLAADTSDNRNRLQPLLEETFYVQGMSNDQVQDLARLAREVFNVQSVTASSTGGTLLVRADARTMELVNATYEDLIEGGADVLLDVAVYEVDRSRTRNFGVALPSGASLFSVATELQNALNSNAAALTAAQQAGLIKQGSLSDNAFKLLEVTYLYQAGLLSSTQTSEFNSLLSLGYLGTLKGLPIAGVTLASSTSVNALLQSSDARLLDSVTLRGSSGQKASFRVGERYPIETSSYTTGGSSALSSALSSASSAIQTAAAAYLGASSSVTIPQINFEDIGLTLEATPTVQRSQDVNLALHFKIEALGGASLNNIPVLTTRYLTSTATVPAGQTAMIVSDVNSSELRSVLGFPGLNELPGFSGTDRDSMVATQELLITLTPHIVRNTARRQRSEPLLMPHTTASN